MSTGLTFLVFVYFRVKNKFYTQRTDLNLNLKLNFFFVNVVLNYHFIHFKMI